MTRYPRAALIPIVLLLAAAPLHAADSGEAPPPRLRATDPDVDALISDGRARSPAFDALVRRLDNSDVVVYVHNGQLRSRIEGQLTFVSAVAGLRYVVVQVQWDLPPRRKIAAIGHELQHAIEIADQPAVVDQPSLAAAYGRIGFERGLRAALPVFDTDAAVAAGERIWKELQAPGLAADE